MSRVVGVLAAAACLWVAAVLPVEPFVLVLLGGALVLAAVMLLIWVVVPHRVHASMQAGADAYTVRARAHAHEREARKALDATWHRKENPETLKATKMPERPDVWREGY